MARVEPIAYEDLDDETRARIEAGRATGMYTTPLPLQIVAHSKVALRAMDESYKAQFRCGARRGPPPRTHPAAQRTARCV